ncbi:SGNH/GDSL hydrolase family protein [Glutamicibacter nicotianae]|uniref:SGNH hydrolase-type esterase domain-containing protein n=1 Tax=Glutamicibacter nicotianae TaxID=37929 RepID=A0ABQ0RLP5_GLUNI|nr:SGNH/GDSL hydrolase family protein [Glutamicibacter nicotianae]GEC12741.1 hypothetical protein ANI01nite_19440 [Glutamicibacter nicotianae]
MAWILIANLKGGKGDKGDTGNTYMGQLASGTNLDTWFGLDYVGSWGVPTQAIVDTIGGRPTGAKPGSVFVMPIGSSASIQTWTEYGAEGRVWSSSISNGARLSPWKELSASADFGNIALTTIAHIDDITWNSEYTIWNGTVAGNMGAPAPNAGKIKTEILGNTRLQTWTSFVAVAPGPSIYIRAAGSTGYGLWYKVHPSAQPSPSGSSTARSGFKNVPLALTQQTGNATETVSDATVRFPVQYSVAGKRARLHIRNWNYYNGTSYNGAVSFTGAWFGPASGANFTSTPLQVLPAFTTPTDGTEYVSPWFNITILEDRYQLLSLGFTNTAGQVNALSRGGGYRSTNSADASLATGFTGAAATDMPFDWYLEVEVPADTNVVAGFGDSNTVGTGTTLPVFDSWLSQFCRGNQALPYFMAVHGSNSDSWDDPASPAWGHYAGSARPDSVVYFLGQNDLQEGVSLSTMQANIGRVLPIVRDKLAPDVYAAYITPANNKSNAVNDVRKAYNSWLGTKPLGLKDAFNFSAAVSDDDATIRASDNFDGLHMLTSGHTKMAAVLESRPIMPVVLSQADVVALKALV